MPDDIKEARKLNRIELERVLNEYIYLNKSEIMARVKANDTPALEVMIGTIIAKAATSGDHTRLNFLLDRLVGKSPEQKEEIERKPIILAYRLDDEELE